MELPSTKSILNRLRQIVTFIAVVQTWMEGVNKPSVESGKRVCAYQLYLNIRNSLDRVPTFAVSTWTKI
jgi:hypothetical protein